MYSNGREGGLRIHTVVVQIHSWVLNMTVEKLSHQSKKFQIGD
jgi:hypothetical protein